MEIAFADDGLAPRAQGSPGVAKSELRPTTASCNSAIRTPPALNMHAFTTPDQQTQHHGSDFNATDMPLPGLYKYMHKSFQGDKTVEFQQGSMVLQAPNPDGSNLLTIPKHSSST